ncbi:hypothetical protein AB3X30_26695, partial [Raoultella terrigena]|uniref:hypothetical protein n=1 Tax=Raoultella terrigena TaxID=577 RepID=UPI00349F6FFA
LCIPQRQQLSVFSKYLSGTKPGLLVLNDVSLKQKNNRRFKKRRLVSVFQAAYFATFTGRMTSRRRAKKLQKLFNSLIFIQF